MLDLVEEGLVDGLRIDHPDGLADPRGYLERLAGRGRRARLGREDPRAGRAAARLAGRGDDGLRLPQRRAGAVRRPGRRGGADRARRRAATVREVAARRRSSSRRRRRSSPRSSGCARLLDVPDLERALASLPVYRTYVEPWSGRVEDADREALAGLPDELRRVLLLEERGPRRVRRRASSRRPAPVMAKGVEDTAFYRYVRLLALNEVGGDPGRFGLSRRGIPPRERPSAPTASRGTLLAGHDARHEAKRRRARADRRARGHGGARGASARRALARARPRRCATATRPTGPRSCSSTRRSSAPGRSAPSGSSRTSRRRCARRSATRAGSTPNDELGGARSSASATGLLRTRRSSPTSSRSPRRSRGRRAVVDRPARAAAHLAGRARHLQRRRALVPRARRPRQPPAGRLGRPPRRARLARTRRTRESVKLHVIREALALRAPPARGVRRALRAAAGRRRNLRVPPRRATSSSPCRCAATSPRSSCRAGAGATCSRASRTRSAATACCCSSGGEVTARSEVRLRPTAADVTLRPTR